MHQRQKMLVGSRVVRALHQYCWDGVCSPWQFGDLSLPPTNLLVGITGQSKAVCELTRGWTGLMEGRR